MSRLQFTLPYTTTSNRCLQYHSEYIPLIRHSSILTKISISFSTPSPKLHHHARYGLHPRSSNPQHPLPLTRYRNHPTYFTIPYPLHTRTNHQNKPTTVNASRPETNSDTNAGLDPTRTPIQINPTSQSRQAFPTNHGLRRTVCYWFGARHCMYLGTRVVKKSRSLELCGMYSYLSVIHTF